MAKSIIPATPATLAEFLAAPAQKQIGRPHKKFGAVDIQVAINKDPITPLDRHARVRAMRRHEQLIPTDEYFEFPDPLVFDEDTESNYDEFKSIIWS